MKFTYALTGWLDLGGEFLTSHTVQTDDLNSVELTPRADLHFHLFSRDIPSLLHDRERPPVTERFANQQRIRAGFGHRRSHDRDLQVLYVLPRSRNNTSSGFTTSDNAIDVRVKRVL